MQGALVGPGTRLVLRDVTRATVLAGLAMFFALLSATTVVFAPPLLRLLLYLVIVFALVSLVLADARAGVLGTVTFLIGVEFLRRILIARAGWSSFDPLLLVGPTVVIVLMVQQFVLRRRPLAPDKLSLLILFVLVVAVLEIPNPASGGIGSGLPGFLFVGFPLFWFFVGRELATPALVRRLQLIVVCGGVAVALYGLCQTQLGFPSWDLAWLHVTGYSSLKVGDETRAFGTFASSAEYALFLGSGLAVATSLALHRTTAAVLAIPPLAVALFLSSGRSALVTAFFAVVVVCGLRTHRPVTAFVVILVSIVGAFGALSVFGDALDHSANNSGNSLVSHQVGGLTDPLNPNSSTLLLHLTLVSKGISSGVHQPLGRGPGASNSGGSSNTNNDTESTEVDLSNAFVNSGLPGGIAYLAVFITTFVLAIRGYMAGYDMLLGVIGLLIVGAGQWLTGGHYALSPITWLLVGAVSAVNLQMRADRRALEALA